jgi:hypothetical protein
MFSNHRCTQGRGKGKYRASPGKFQNIENAIKPKIRTLLAIFPETLDPLGILAKTTGTPSPGFSTFVHLC